MKRTAQIAAGIAAAAIAVPMTATTASAATVAPAARTAAQKPAPVDLAAFTPVAQGVTDVTSPVDGIAYALDATGLVRYTRSATGAVASTRIAVPGIDAGAQLESGGGVTYLLTDALYTVKGTTVTRVAALPTTMPEGVKRLGDMLLAVDTDGSAWVARVGDDGTPNIMGGTAWFEHLVGGAWVATPLVHRITPGLLDARVEYGVPRMVLATAAMGQIENSYRFVGGAWSAPTAAFASRGGILIDSFSVTSASATDYTTWGYASSLVGQNLVVEGRCTHVVNGTTSTCIPPSWPVSAAVRLGDGSVVLGGQTVSANQTAPGFALVTTPGATPKPVNGAVGDGVQQLVAAPTGSVVWAVTQTGSRFHRQHATTTTLQVMGAPAASTPTKPTPKPKPKHLPKPKKATRPVHPTHPHATPVAHRAAHGGR